LGTKWLPIRVGDKENGRNLETNFLAVDISIAYSVLIGCSTVNAIKAVVAPYLFFIQFKLDDERVRNSMETKRWQENATTRV